MIVSAEGLEKVYGAGEGAYHALRGVSVRVERGEFVAVTGPSGCGKSTLMHLLGLLDRPSGGKLSVFGQAAETLDDRDRTRLRRQKVGFVFQAFHLLLRQSAVENVCLPLAYAGVPRVERELRALELLNRVGLGAKATNSPLQLSGGERQRVAIARALANRPELLLADEPTGNLDSKSSADVMALLKELNREGTSILLVTHDAGVAAAAARAIRMRDGKVLA